MGIFKAYDIRGIYPDELDEALAEKIGRAAARLFQGRTVAVGRDMRVAAPAIAAALIRGLTTAGKHVVDIGMVTTPMVPFAVATLDCDGGIMVTASHNPKDYIGFKLTARGAEPVAYGSGIERLERWVADDDLPKAAKPGSVATRDILPQYIDHLLAAAEGIEGLKIVVDAGNGMAGWLMPPLFERVPGAEVVPLYFEPDGTFPHHEANPLKPENLADLQRKVVETEAHLGVAFDGDGDRVAFVDERGAAVACDIITALIARETLRKHPGAAILYDLRSSWAVPEEIKAAGGVPVMTRVGHSYIKRAMRDCDAAFGGELSGHYYFRENFYCDSGAFALLKVLSLVSRERKPLSELVRPIQRYYGSGEINSQVIDKDAKIEEIARTYAGGKATRLDGLTVEFDDWWFNVRPSNTEPVLRLVVEAKSRETMEARRDALVAQIRRAFTLSKVLMTTDFSDYSRHALPYALGLARDHGAELHILHVVPTSEMAVQFDVAGPVFEPGLFEGLEESAREQLEKLVPEKLREGLKLTLAVRRGAAFVEIVRYAREQGIDLIVLATHGRTGLQHALFGGVADKVVRKAPCPVLSVRPAGHQFTMP